MAAWDGNLTYTPNGQALPGSTPATGGASGGALSAPPKRFPAPRMGVPLDAKGALPQMAYGMNRAMDAIFNGGMIKGKDGNSLFGVGSGTSGAAPNANAGGLTYTPNTPPTGTAPTTPAATGGPTRTPGSGWSGSNGASWRPPHTPNGMSSNPAWQQWRQQMDAWRAARPQRAEGMTPEAWREQLQQHFQTRPRPTWQHGHAHRGQPGGYKPGRYGGAFRPEHRAQIARRLMGD